MPDKKDIERSPTELFPQIRDAAELSGDEDSNTAIGSAAVEMEVAESDAGGLDQDPVASSRVAQFLPWDERELQLHRLPAMLTSILLPTLGEVHQLAAFRADLDRRYRLLQADNAGLAEGDRKQRQSEESMLSQILQWLSLGGQTS